MGRRSWDVELLNKMKLRLGSRQDRGPNLSPYFQPISSSTITHTPTQTHRHTHTHTHIYTDTHHTHSHIYSHSLTLNTLSHTFTHTPWLSFWSDFPFPTVLIPNYWDEWLKDPSPYPTLPNFSVTKNIEPSCFSWGLGQGLRDFTKSCFSGFPLSSLSWQ